MRPTFLNFRSPKEQSGEYLFPTFTSSGANLLAKLPEIKKKPDFARGPRWEHINEVARRTGFRVGPGAYNVRLTTNNGNSTKIVKELNIQDSKKYDYYFVGNQLVYRDKDASRSRSNSRDNSFQSKSSIQHIGPDGASPLAKRSFISTGAIPYKRPQSSQVKKSGNFSFDNGHAGIATPGFKGSVESINEHSMLLGSSKKKTQTPSVNQLDDPFLYANFRQSGRGKSVHNSGDVQVIPAKGTRLRYADLEEYNPKTRAGREIISKIYIAQK